MCSFPQLISVSHSLNFILVFVCHFFSLPASLSLCTMPFCHTVKSPPLSLSQLHSSPSHLSVSLPPSPYLFLLTIFLSHFLTSPLSLVSLISPFSPPLSLSHFFLLSLSQSPSLPCLSRYSPIPLPTSHSSFPS